MKSNILIYGFLTIIFCTNTSIQSKPKTNLVKKKIVILTSKGGNGHMSACNTLKTVLPDYQIKLINPIYDHFHKVIDGESFYNKLFQKNWIKTINFGAKHFAPTYFRLQKKSFRKRFLKLIKKEKPDLLISVIPFLNSFASYAANKTNTPFLIITLDADIKNWLLDLNKCKSHNFFITVQRKTPRVKKQLRCKKISPNKIYEVGTPLRKEFFTPKNKNLIKKQWKMPINKKIILLMGGGAGSSSLIKTFKALAQSDQSLHLLTCVGRNKKLADKIKTIKYNKNISYSIIPFTKKIPDLMAVSDLIVTRPGPNVCNEAIHMNLPIIVDMTGSCLFWEKATIDWIKLDGDGCTFKKYKNLNKLVKAQLIKKRIFKKRKNNFNKNIKKIVKNMIKS